MRLKYSKGCRLKISRSIIFRKTPLGLAKTNRDLAKKLINADEVKVAAFNLGRRVRDRLMTIPHRMGSVLASVQDSKQIEEILEQELRQSLEELPE